MLLNNHKIQSGFTLLEMAVVLVIIGLLLGGVLMPLSSQHSQKNIKTTEVSLQNAYDALLGYAIINGRFPCPATNSSNGLPVPNVATTSCSQEHGFLPAREIGVSGNFNSNNLVLDAWANPIRYSLASVNSGEYSSAIQGSPVVNGYRICSQSSCNSDEVLSEKNIAVICSTGKNGAQTTASSNQRENIDGDTDFVLAEYSEAVGNEFDDICRWVTPNHVVLELIRAGKL